MTRAALRQGTIIWATVPDPHGVRKRRPVIIVTGAADLATAERLVGVAVSTTFREPLPASQILLPWDPLGRSMTHLRRRSVAICDWLITVLPDEIDAVAGEVPPETLVEILRAVQLNGPT